MKFPGSKLLHHWDLTAQKVSLSDLLRSCQKVGLTGFAELHSPDGHAMIFYYQGGEVNALYRFGPVAFNGAAALERLREHELGEGSSLTMYELPLDVAHLLRGITNRQKLAETLKGKAALTDLLARLLASEHTGTLEIQSSLGAAMVLLVGGRVSNVYWETSGGLTYEMGDARQRLEHALDKEEAQLFLAQFSRDAWKSRHDVQATVARQLEPEEVAPPADKIVAEETALRTSVLEDLFAQLPSVQHGLIFDLLTGSVLASKIRGTSAIRMGLLAQRVPAIGLYLRDVVTADQDQVELIEVSTQTSALLMAVSLEAQEAIAVLAEKSQPTALIGAALNRAARSYATRLHPSRGVVSGLPK